MNSQTEQITTEPPTRPIWGLVSFAAALLLSFFYLFTAHLTVGHEKDFGCLWMGGKIVASGNGDRLYDPDFQTETLNAAFPADVVDELQNDGSDGAVGRLPYPPIQPVLYAPFGFLSPKAAQTLMVYLSVIAVLVTALAICDIAQHQIPWSTAVALTMVQAAFFSTSAIGQNAAVTLLIITLGWWAWSHQKDILAGLIWGLLAYKPTWAVVIAWVPLIARRPKAYIGLSVSVAGLILLTIPLCGIDSWWEWFRLASNFENADVEKWIWIRKDLRNLLYHLLPWSNSIIESSGLLVIVTVTGFVLHRSQNSTSTNLKHSLLFSAIVLSCPRFMFYDLLVSTPAWLFAFVYWKDSSRFARTILCLLFSIYLLTPLVLWNNWPESWPVETVAILGLWLWSIGQSCSRCHRIGKSWTHYCGAG